MNSTQKYSPTETTELVQLYQSGTSVDALAQKFDKSPRSVIAKLSRLGVYKVAKVETLRETKSVLVSRLENLTGAGVGDLASLEKADKSALYWILAHILLTDAA